ncbi:hypothetical protein WR25_06713 [Diploscapter pachys]|uniref:DUF6036 domain-containing protein n=1 Tax=Diploscapter pachys TaxID=2018661 RepID=A0A2A2M2Z6_9BILA|nr:hypothetical protein WR25_06713 [Diploscapter pachys]
MFPGQRNSPEYLPEIAQALAEVIGVDVEQLAKTSTHNACALFGWLAMDRLNATPPHLNTQSDLGQALISMFKSVEAEMVQEQAGPGALKIIIFGGCAVHLYTHHRVSVDVDAECYENSLAEPFDLQALLAEVPQAFFDAQSGRMLELHYDLHYTTTFGPIHEDYLERSLPLAEFPETSPLHIRIAAPVDIAISKLARASEQDLSDIHALLRSGLILTTDLRRLALEAIDVPKMAKRLDGNLFTSALDKLARSPLNEADDSTLVHVAQAVWYSDVDLVRRVGYLLEKLTRFSCASVHRVMDTRHALELFPHAMPIAQSPTAVRKRRDELAASWGLDEGLGKPTPETAAPTIRIASSIQPRNTRVCTKCVCAKARQGETGGGTAGVAPDCTGVHEHSEPRFNAVCASADTFRTEPSH